MEQATERAVRSALERLVPAPLARRAKLEALDGGINQRSYLVAVGGARWVLRMPAPGTMPLLDVVTEANVMRIAADAKLAPAVRGVDAETGALLTDFFAGARPWTPEDARRSSNIERIAALLRSLHSLDSRAPAFAPEPIARSYLSALSAGVGTRRAPADSSTSAWADELIALARHHEKSYPARALCHNDLVAANVLDGGTLMLLDFEYAVRAAPILDLASLAGMNDYGDGECRELLAAYATESVPTISIVEFVKTVRMVRLMAYFWARLGELHAANSDAYRALASELEARLR